MTCKLALHKRDAVTVACSSYLLITPPVNGENVPEFICTYSGFVFQEFRPSLFQSSRNNSETEESHLPNKAITSFTAVLRVNHRNTQTEPAQTPGTLSDLEAEHIL